MILEQNKRKRSVIAMVVLIFSTKSMVGASTEEEKTIFADLGLDPLSIIPRAHLLIVYLLIRLECLYSCPG